MNFFLNIGEYSTNNNKAVYATSPERILYFYELINQIPEKNRESKKNEQNSEYAFI